jgi:hypothetical protein
LFRCLFPAGNTNGRTGVWPSRGSATNVIMWSGFGILSR